MEPTHETPTAPAASPVAAPAPPARSTLVDPRELTRAPKPMPTREHTMRRSDGTKMTVLLQGLTWLEKESVDMWSRADARNDETNGTMRPSMLYPRWIAKALRMPNGAHAFVEEHEIRAYAVALAETFPPAEINRAAEIISELNGYGQQAEDAAGKA